MQQGFNDEKTFLFIRTLTHRMISWVRGRYDRVDDPRMAVRPLSTQIAPANRPLENLSVSRINLNGPFMWDIRRV